MGGIRAVENLRGRVCDFQDSLQPTLPRPPKHGLSVAVIAGISGGAAVLVACLCLLAVRLRKSRSQDGYESLVNNS